MKKVTTIAVTSLLLIGLTGCSGSSSSAPTYAPDPTPTYTPEPTQTTPTYTDDEIFTGVVRAQYPTYASLYSNAELINIATQTCRYFGNGGSFEELAYELVMTIDSSDPGFFEFIGFTLGAAVATYCPQYSYLVS